MSTRTTSRLSKWVLGSPLIVFALIFVVYPVYQGIQTGFYSLSLQNPDTLFTGLENFGTVLTDPGFLAAAKFTLLFALAVTAIETVLGFGLALLVNREFPGKKVFFTMLLVPIMVAPALLGVMFRLLLNGDIGLVPEVLRGVGLDVSLFAPNTVVPLLVLLDVLQWTPFAFLIMYAGLQSFPSDVLEAAQVDGAGRLRTLRSIVVPMMKPIIFAALFLRLIDAIRTFDVVYVLTAGGPGTKTTTMSIYIYKTAFESGQFGLAAAASTIVMVVLIPFVPLFVKRIATPGAAE
ncbi:carbohydrate ABC transporter permease [Kribbella solani]|uniref:Multiple sugar transport system permease protein n=1 Tax=Kribbella solani TaxID=236067 RepID=A0A841DHN4_9ACTN|nr:sugar ABC transporter permease [Kribbella solani]MBB5977411.1 multiple sugar transport system permease protein [Kribbella solani]